MPPQIEQSPGTYACFALPTFSKYASHPKALRYLPPAALAETKLPFETSEKQLLTLSGDVAEVVKELKQNKYSQVIRGLDSVSDRMKGLVLSAMLPADISETLDVLLVSLETVIQEIYEHAKRSKRDGFEQEEEATQFLRGLENTLQAYAQLDEWKGKMAKEWGTE